MYRRMIQNEKMQVERLQSKLRKIEDTLKNSGSNTCGELDIIKGISWVVENTLREAIQSLNTI